MTDNKLNYRRVLRSGKPTAETCPACGKRMKKAAFGWRECERCKKAFRRAR